MSSLLTNINGSSMRKHVQTM